NLALHCQADEIRPLQLVEPFTVKACISIWRWSKNFVDLRHVGLGVAHDFFRTERRARSGAAGRVADHSGEVAYQERDCMPEILKVLKLAQQDSVAEMQIGRGGIKSGFDAKGLAGSAGFLQLLAQLGLLH